LRAGDRVPVTLVLGAGDGYRRRPRFEGRAAQGVGAEARASPVRWRLDPPASGFSPRLIANRRLDEPRIRRPMQYLISCRK
jgi:hypothetical protein